MTNGVSDILKEVILELMEIPELLDFHLGGGTNLSLKYNHRQSIDIDLFCSSAVGSQRMVAIETSLKERYANDEIETSLENSGSENLSFINAYINRNTTDIKIQIIQNVKILHPVDAVDDIRLIHDLDIGSLKLLAAADRGEQKDFYDLHLLCEKHGLDKIYDELKERHRLFNPATDENIFNKPIDKPKENLSSDLTPLGNFNRAGDLKKPGNRIVFTESSGLKNLSLFALKQQWTAKVRAFAEQRGLKYAETKKQPRRQFGF